MDFRDLDTLTLPGLDLSRRAANRIRRHLRSRAYADLSITVASVAWVSGNKPSVYKAGATITAGQPLYVSDATTTPLTVSPALNDTLAHAACVGISLHASLAGQPISVAPPGCVINVGATLAIGTNYVVSANAGKIAPDADLATGNYSTTLGRALTAANLQLDCIPYTGIHA